MILFKNMCSLYIEWPDVCMLYMGISKERCMGNEKRTNEIKKMKSALPPTYLPIPCA